MEKLSIGYMPLNDCAPLVAAYELGLFREAGFDVHLQGLSSWATARDLLSIGALDATHMLAPATLVKPPEHADAMVAPITLSLCGNCIVIAASLGEQLQQQADLETLLTNPIAGAQALVGLARQKRAQSGHGLRFGVVHPHSSHYLDLCRLVIAGGGDPAQDLSIAIVPPQDANRFLAEGLIDGFSAGEPWGSLAVHFNHGIILTTAHDLWPNRIEKMLALNLGRRGKDSAWIDALIEPIMQASKWLDMPESRLKMAGILSDGQYVKAPVELIRAGLCGDIQRSARVRAHQPDFVVFHRYLAGMPWHSQARWIAQNMMRLGQISPQPLAQLNPQIEVIWPTEHYERVATRLDMPSPAAADDAIGHGASWPMDTSLGPVTMGPNKRFED